MNSLFNQVDVFFNQKPVSPPTNVYAYRAYIETLLNYGPSAKTSHLTSVLWYGDTAAKMDNGEDANAGLVARRK